jgi:tetratricopeptide (TPR) repeat protein
LKMLKLSRALYALSCFILVLCLSVVTSAQQAEPSAKSQAEELVKKGDELYKAGKFKEAIEAYKEALNRDPNNDQAIGYIAYSFNKMGDKESAREWMKRRIDMPGQTPSRKASTLADLALLYWDDAHLQVVGLLAAGNTGAVKAEDKAAVARMINEGIDSAQKAVTIAPRSVKGFNLLNLLYRSSAAMEADPARRKELISRADEALRQAIQFYEANAQVQQSADMFMVPTISTLDGSELGEAVKMGQATKKVQPDSIKDAKGPVAVEVLVGRDGKTRFHRVVAGQGKTGDAALAAARQWTFEPTTFEGHPVQVFSIINFTVKQ